MITHNHKRGDTLQINGTRFQSDGKTPFDLDGVSIRSQVRDRDDNLIDEFEVSITDSKNGKFSMVIYDTSDWPITSLYFDVQYEYDNIKLSEDVIKIIVLKDITQ